MADPVWTEVLSSRVQKVGYEPDTQTLLVTWARGKISAYSGVPPNIADEASKSWSVGQYLNEKVIGKYPMRYEG